MHRPMFHMMSTLLLVMCMATSAFAADYTFVSFDVPGASATAAEDINDSGTIVGVYSESGNFASGCHGFIRSATGVFTTVDYPGAAGTFLVGINNAGDTVGFYSTSSCGGY